MSAVKRMCSDADDIVGSLYEPMRRRSHAERVRSDLGLAVAERDTARRYSAAWKELARLSRREIAYLERELEEAEHRAREAAREASVASRVLAVGAASKDDLLGQIADLEASVEALAVDRQRMQADILRLITEKNDAHDEATHLLTRARNAERRCVQQDVEIISRIADTTGLQYEVERLRGQAAAERLRTAARIADLEAQRDRETVRANNADAACRDATAALVKAEAAVERARECVRYGLSAASDEDFIAEYNRRFSVRGAA